MNQLSLATLVATARSLLAFPDPEEYGVLPGEQHANVQEAIGYLGAVQQWFPGGTTADA